MTTYLVTLACDHELLVAANSPEGAEDAGVAWFVTEHASNGIHSAHRVDPTFNGNPVESVIVVDLAIPTVITVLDRA